MFGVCRNPDRSDKAYYCLLQAMAKVLLIERRLFCLLAMRMIIMKSDLGLVTHEAQVTNEAQS